MVDPIRSESRAQAEVKALFERPEVVEALKKGNVFEIFKNLPANVTTEDIKQYLRDQWRVFMSQLVQEAPPYAGEGMIDPPEMPMFREHNAEMKMGTEERELFTDSIIGSFGKAMVTKGAGSGAAEGDGMMSQEELLGMVGGTLDEWETFVQETASSIIDAQMVADFKSKTEEVQRDMERLVMLAKQGAIDPAFLIIALTKVNATKNGVLMTWLGKKAFNVNETLNRISNELQGASALDFGTMEAGRNKSREGQYQLQFLVSDMQKVMQDLASGLEFCSSFLKEWNSHKGQITNRLNPGGQ